MSSREIFSRISSPKFTGGGIRSASKGTCLHISSIAQTLSTIYFKRTVSTQGINEHPNMSDQCLRVSLKVAHLRLGFDTTSDLGESIVSPTPPKRSGGGMRMPRACFTAQGFSPSVPDGANIGIFARNVQRYPRKLSVKYEYNHLGLPF